MEVYTRAIKTYWDRFGDSYPGDIMPRPETRLYTIRDDEIEYSLNLWKVISSNPDDWFTPEKDIFLQSLKYLSSGGILLDVGSGSGRVSVAYMRKGFSVKAIDLAPELVDVCIQRGIDAEILDIKSDNLKRNSYDGVLCYLNVLAEISDDLTQCRALINKVLRAIKSGGILIWFSLDWDMNKQEHIDYVALNGPFKYKCKMEYLGYTEPYKTLYHIPMEYVEQYFDNNKWETLYTFKEGVFYGTIFRKR